MNYYTTDTYIDNGGFHMVFTHEYEYDIINIELIIEE